MQTVAGYTDHVAEARGGIFHWLEWGDPSAPAMVLLHGLTGHAHIWDHMAPTLAEHYHVIALDQRGHGDTSHTESYTTQEFVDDLEAMREIWRLDQFVLMGLSMGGHNAMAYAAQHPGVVTRAIVIDIPPRMKRELSPERGEHVRLAETGHGTYTNLDDVVRDEWPGVRTAPEENLRYRTYWNVRHAADGTMQLKYDAKVQADWNPADLTETLSQIGCPVLLVRAGKTAYLPRERAETMAAAMPDGELVEVADSGHSVPTDRPEELAPIVMDWLARRG